MSFSRPFSLRAGAVAVDAVTLQLVANVLSIKALGVDSAQLAAAGVIKTKLAGSFSKSQLVAGQDETGDTTIPVTGLAVGDELVAVFVQDGVTGVWTQRANADFTVGAGNLTVVANAVNNAANKYVIFWNDLT